MLGGKRHNPSAIVWDSVAVLTLLDAVNKKGLVNGNLMLQKVGFLAELEAARQHLRVARFRFFRYNLGPFSAELANAVAALESKGIITKRRVLTPRGRYVLEYAADSIAQSQDASRSVELLNEVGQKHGNKTGEDLKEYVYGLKVPVADWNGMEGRVRDIPMFTDILDPARDPHLVDVQPFDSDTAEELAAELEMADDVLDEGSAAFRRTINDAMKRASQACS